MARRHSLPSLEGTRADSLSITSSTDLVSSQDSHSFVCSWGQIVGFEIGGHQSPFLRSGVATSLVVLAGFFPLRTLHSVRMGLVLSGSMAVEGDLFSSNFVSTLVAMLQLDPAGG